MKKIIGFLLVIGLYGCGSQENRNTTAQITDSTAATPLTPEPPGADAAAGNSVLTGSMAGYYVESFAGANSHSYEFKFKNGGYTGVYEEYQDSEHNRIVLKDVIGDETAKTFTFDQNGIRLTGAITAVGFELGEETFERREETK
ncbi:hypothetical protein [Polluticoccus soli]|uniref:hypothetical protein n=1 Tax=Polluticoccus soli TaxID=3034150 RepID=UPI0023E2A5C6|nr:hypothetical protein [Flavipsychrobacter sp. JY13-12]